MKTSRAAWVLVAILIFASTTTKYCSAVDTTGRIHVSGLVAKLIPRHRTIVHSSKKDVERTYSARLDQFPLSVNKSDFGAAYIDFEDDAAQRVLAVVFSRPLFKEGNDETIHLKKPTMEVRVRQAGGGLWIHQWAWIAEDIGYAAMPCWDREADRLVAAENPTVQVCVKGQPEPIATEVMKNGCIGYGWLSRTLLPKDTAKDTELLIKIVHKTGDLFGDISTSTTYVVE